MTRILLLSGKECTLGPEDYTQHKQASDAFDEGSPHQAFPCSLPLCLGIDDKRRSTRSLFGTSEAGSLASNSDYTAMLAEERLQNYLITSTSCTDGTFYGSLAVCITSAVV